MIHLVAAGSAPGRDHALLERPNQDAWAAVEGAWGAAAVVCDGCGSEPHSGVGARLGAAMAVSLIGRQMEAAGRLDLELLRVQMLCRLDLIARTAAIGAREHLLFTLVGAVSAEEAIVFACGDGVWAVDGAVHPIGPFPENRPPYLAYGLEGVPVAFERLYQGPASSIWVGTDGASGIPLETFTPDERFLRNPDMVRRTLRRQRLADDATLALIVRRPL